MPEHEQLLVELKDVHTACGGGMVVYGGYTAELALGTVDQVIVPTFADDGRIVDEVLNFHLIDAHVNSYRIEPDLSPPTDTHYFLEFLMPAGRPITVLGYTAVFGYVHEGNEQGKILQGGAKGSYRGVLHALRHTTWRSSRQPSASIEMNVDY